MKRLFRMALLTPILVSSLFLGGVRTAHASDLLACAGINTWTIADTLNAETVPGFVAWGPRTCADVTILGLPFNGLVVGPSVGGAGYLYQGNCLEGTMEFANGGLGVFLGGIEVIELQGASSGVFVGVSVPTPVAVPCLGPAGSTRTWAGPGVLVLN